MENAMGYENMMETRGIGYADELWDRYVGNQTPEEFISISEECGETAA